MYKACNVGTIMMCNDVNCKTIGIGTIKIKMFDGALETLTNIRHVPDL